MFVRHLPQCSRDALLEFTSHFQPRRLATLLGFYCSTYLFSPPPSSPEPISIIKLFSSPSDPTSMWLEVDEEQNPSYVQVGTRRVHFCWKLLSSSQMPGAEGRDRTARGQMLLHEKEDKHFPENTQLQTAFYGKMSKPCQIPSLSRFLHYQNFKIQMLKSMFLRS